MNKKTAIVAAALLGILGIGIQAGAIAQSTTVYKGRLLEDGKEIGNFGGMRSSMGGVFPGFKGSCAVLNRCLQTLAEDVSRWLKNPVKDSRIGE